ncbi:MAG TPA: hypothetical protein VL500_06125 [Candidatus Eisenbacteria bacterium]|nr:hypothetical protein [Candidatus Eisenbacteria bacterium]
MPERPTPEGFLPKEEAKESQEAEIVRRRFEYRDANGEVLGTAEVELEGPEIELEYKTVKGKEPGKGRKLRSFIIRGEKDGTPTEIDMMELANPHGVEVVSATEHLENYHYSDDAKVAMAPPLESPIDVGVFLHELGHADQYHEQRFAKITPLYGRSKPATSRDAKMPYLALMELLESVVEAVPDAKKVMDEDSLKQLRTLEDRRNDALDRKGRLDRALEEQERLRSAELQALLIDAVKRRMDVDGILAESERLIAAEGHVTPPLKASPETAKLVDKLTDAGIRFQEEYREDGLEDRAYRPQHVRIAAERELPADVLSELSVTTPAQVKDILEQSVFGALAHETDLTYDPATEELIARVPYQVTGQARPPEEQRRFGGSGPRRRMFAMRLNVPQDVFDEYLRLREGADRQVRQLEEAVDKAYDDAVGDERAQGMMIESLNMKDIAALPTRMMERDATRRALQWLRTVRQRTGVDLLATHQAPREALAAMSGGQTATDCVGATLEGIAHPDEQTVEAKVLTDLKRALTSYGADKMQLRPPGEDDGAGFIPIAGHERTKKD